MSIGVHKVSEADLGIYSARTKPLVKSLPDGSATPPVRLGYETRITLTEMTITGDQVVQFMAQNPGSSVEISVNTMTIDLAPRRFWTLEKVVIAALAALVVVMAVVLGPLLSSDAGQPERPVDDFKFT
jgi:hypothetical protein